MNNQLVAHRYQILNKLGEGGFGTTYLAEDVMMPSRRRCVIKQLKPLNNEPVIHQLIQERFQKEAAILEQLSCHNSQIPQLYGYFEDAGQFYLVQEYIDGETLSSYIEHHGLLDEKTVLEILLKLLPVLEYVHNHRIVHRDIKPDNIILRHQDNSPVLIDFGAVKETMGTVMTSTGSPASSIVIGTPGFMPSEQSAGRPVYATDLYALGLTAIYLLTGKTPQELETDPLTGEIIWRLYAPKISSTLAEVLDKAIKSHHKERFLTAKAMLEALELNSPSTLVISSSNQASERQKTVVLPSVPPSKRSWTKTFLIVSGIILFPLSLGLYFWQNQEGEKAFVDNNPANNPPIVSDEEDSQPTEPVFQGNQNQFDLAKFPQSSCGDSLPVDGGAYPLNFYPVFIQFSEEILQKIKLDFCQDAFAKIRQDTGKEAIQIASFSSLEKAREFSFFIKNKVGNGEVEVGEPTLVTRHSEEQLINEDPENQPVFPEEQNLDENQAKAVITNLYSLVSAKKYEEARQLFDSSLSSQFDPRFFAQFEQVTVENLQIVSKTNSLINFQGENTYIYPDGSTQQERRSYTIKNINGEPKITSSQFVKVIKFR